MENRVGDRLPSKASLQKIENQIVFARSEVAKYGVELSSDERKHATRFRTGGERIVRLVAQIAVSKKLSVPNFPVSDMLRDLELVERLEPLARAIEGLNQLVSDTILEARSECWWAAMAYYSLLSEVARADPQIEAQLADAVEFFAQGRRSKDSSSSATPDGAPTPPSP